MASLSLLTPRVVALAPSGSTRSCTACPLSTAIFSWLRPAILPCVSALNLHPPYSTSRFQLLPLLQVDPWAVHRECLALSRHHESPSRGLEISCRSPLASRVEGTRQPRPRPDHDPSKRATLEKSTVTMSGTSVPSGRTLWPDNNSNFLMIWINMLSLTKAELGRRGDWSLCVVDLSIQSGARHVVPPPVSSPIAAYLARELRLQRAVSLQYLPSYPLLSPALTCCLLPSWELLTSSSRSPRNGRLHPS